MNNCGCDKCEYCHYNMHDTRKGFLCKHPNYEYICKYFKEKNIKKMAGFIGFGERFADVPKNKTTPKWCPKLAEAVPVVRGKWIRVPSSDMVTGEAYKCSECGKLRFGSYLPNFCQHCGADMRKRVTE